MSQLCANSGLSLSCSSSLRALGCVLPKNLTLLVSSVLLCGLLGAPDPARAQAGNTRDIQVVEGDILVSSRKSTRSISLPSSSQLWTDGIVPYSIDPALSKSSTLAVTMAIAHWNKVGGISLVSLDDWPAGQERPRDSIRFQPGSGCASWVGRLGDEQEVWVATNCAAGSVMHEIGHALGLEHEHTRPDRDQYIQINWDNIADDKQHNFDVAPAGSRMLGEYDYESIMHYGTSNFSTNGKPTISPLLVSADVIGQRVTPSVGDLAAIAKLYGTDLSIVTQVSGDESGSEVTIHVSNELAQGANTINVDVQLGSARVRSFTGSGWQCEALEHGQVTCSLGRLAGSSSSLLTLMLDGEVQAADIAAVVRSKTPDDDTLNNADNVAAIPDLAPANALADPQTFTETVTTTTYGAAVFWLCPALLLALFLRQTGCRINRQARHRIK